MTMSTPRASLRESEQASGTLSSRFLERVQNLLNSSLAELQDKSYDKDLSSQEKWKLIGLVAVIGGW